MLVVEDDPAIAAGMVRGLRLAGFEVELAVDGAQGAARAVDADILLVVLDLMLPEMDGFDVLRTVRARSAVPFVVVTARTELPDRLRAFALGAVDYLPKPFFVEELVARVQTRLALTQSPKRVVECGPLQVDIEGRAVNVDGVATHLTPTEFAILRYLVERPGRAVNRNDLASALQDLGDADPHNVDAHVSRLRRKLGNASGLVKTVWGHGYRFESEQRRDDR